MGFIYDKEIIGYMNLFESITQTKVKDCHKSDDELTFILDSIYMSKAIGKKGSNVKKLSQLLRKTIKVVEFNNDVIKFIENLISPVKGNIYKESEEGCPILIGPIYRLLSRLLG